MRTVGVLLAVGTIIAADLPPEETTRRAIWAAMLGQPTGVLGFALVVLGSVIYQLQRRRR